MCSSKQEINEVKALSAEGKNITTLLKTELNFFSQNFQVSWPVQAENDLPSFYLLADTIWVVHIAVLPVMPPD